mmetsp:Transcript_113316/g.225683  ORF Transcript_113316/g.225683 Transcript_113316/m.225683 type:complete len:1175 (-) Transcript_113316:84-3608(-)
MHLFLVNSGSNCLPPCCSLLLLAAWVRAEPVTDLCPEDVMPTEWRGPCLGAQLLFSNAHSKHDLMPEVGNGHLATAMQSDKIYAAGFFNGPARGTNVETTHRASIPRSIYWIDTMHGETFPPGYGRALDMERAVFLQHTKDPVGAEGIIVRERWYAPWQAPTLMVHEIELENPGGISRTVKIQRFRRTRSADLSIQEVNPTRLQALGMQPESVSVLEGSNIIPEADGHPTRFALAENVLSNSVNLLPGKRKTLYALVAIVTSLNSTDPTRDALDTLHRYMINNQAKSSTLFSQHCTAWKERAEAGRVEVAGDLALARVVNASLYFIRSSVRPDWPQGLSPGGLSSNCYRGHTFWDQETWMLPPLLMLEPEAARSLLHYRVNRLLEARKKAAECGSSEQVSWCPQGYSDSVDSTALMFPWESAHTGMEVQYVNGNMGPWGRFEQHINGDIALAARQYWYATHDRTWLADVAFPLIDGIASFYSARLQATLGAQYALNNVMGPDEYHWPVNNSAYSNAIARVALEFAAEAANEVRTTGSKYKDFINQARGLPVLVAPEVPGRIDLKGGYHPEYEGFPKKGDKAEVKQADTILLSFPIGFHMESNVLRNDLEFYESITDQHGPAMTWSLFAIAWLSVGDYSRSISHFRRGYANAQPPYNVWSEYPRGPNYPGCTNFITGAGGFLQSLIFGISGLRVRRDRLEFKAAPPAAIGSTAAHISIHSFHYRSSRLRLEVTAQTAYVELLATLPDAPMLCLLKGDQSPIPLVIGKRYECQRTVASEIMVCDGRSKYTTSMKSSPTVTTTTTAITTTTVPNSPQVANTQLSTVRMTGTSTSTILRTSQAMQTARPTLLSTTGNSSAFLTTTHAVLSETPASTSDLTNAVVVFMTVQNIDQPALMADTRLTAAFKAKIQSVVALEAGIEIQPNDVDVELLPGSVVARSTVTPPDGISATAIHEAFQAALTSSQLLRRTVSQELSVLPGIESVTTGPVQVSDIRIEVKPQVPGFVAGLWLVWPVVIVCCACAVLAMCGTAATQCPRAHSNGAVDDFPFNGTWIAKRDGSGTKAESGSLMVIIGNSIYWHGNGQVVPSRIWYAEDGYHMTNPFHDTLTHEVCLINGELVIDHGHEKAVCFTRFRSQGTPEEIPGQEKPVCFERFRPGGSEETPLLLTRSSEDLRSVN